MNNYDNRTNEELENLKVQMQSEITMEKECDIEYEVGCGQIHIDSWAHFDMVMYLVCAGFTEVDANASEISEDGTGYIWVC